MTAHAEELLHLRAGESRDVGAAIRDADDQTQVFQLKKGLPHGDLAHAHLFGDMRFFERGSRGELAGPDSIAEPLKDLRGLTDIADWSEFADRHRSIIPRQQLLINNRF